MQGTWIKTSTMILLGLVIGVIAGAVFLILTFRFWESLVTPYPLYVTQTRKTVIFFIEIGIYCGAGLVFGIVSSLFVPSNGRDVQVIIGAGLAFILSLPFTLIEGHLASGMLLITIVISAACTFFIKLGQLFVFRFRRIEG